MSDDTDEPRIRTLHSKSKGCACGGHSANDHKKSKQHHGTRVRLLPLLRGDERCDTCEHDRNCHKPKETP